MKKSKSTASTGVEGRPKVDRAETYPGKDHDLVTGNKNTAATNALYSRRISNPRNTGASVSGNGVIKWFKHITDAAESYRNKDAAKGKKSQQPVTMDSSTVHLGTVDEMLAMERTSKTADNENSQRQEYEDAKDVQPGSGYSQQQQQRRQLNSCQSEPVGRVEVMHFEKPQLVQPDEVKVSLTQVNKQETTANLVKLVETKNRMIESAIAEKKNLLARILGIPVEDYDHISDVVDELRNSNDVRELILSSLSQATKLTKLINEQIDNKLLVHEDDISETDDDDDQSTHQPASSLPVLSRSNALEKSDDGADRRVATSVSKEIPIVVSSSQLMAISSRLHDNLTRLMEVISNREQENERLKAEGFQFGNQLGLVTSQGHGVRVNASDEASVLPLTSYHSEVIEPLDHRSGECVASLSIVDPILTEHLEVIEPETFVMKFANTIVKTQNAVGRPKKNKDPSSSTSNSH